MIYYLIGYDYIKIITFISVIFAFALTCILIVLGKNTLPRDAGRAYAINGSKSVGKPRGAGIIFILTFTWQQCSAAIWTTALRPHGVN